MNGLAKPRGCDRGCENIVLFGHNAASEAGRLQPLLVPELRVVPIAEDAPQAVIDEAIGDCRVLVSRSFDERHRAARRLRLLQTTGAGLDRVKTDLLPVGCTVCNVHGHEIGIAEYVLAAMLDLEVGLRRLDHSFKNGSWQGGAFGAGGFHGELHAKTVGILGFGAIGQEVARRASAFGMKVGAISGWAQPGPHLDWCVPWSEIDTHLGQLDYLVVCCPLTSRTAGFLDRNRLRMMKRDAVVINVGRGEIVRESDLVEALNENTIAGAVLDAWYQYPSPGDPDPNPSKGGLREHPRVIATPHASGWTTGLMDRKWKLIATNVLGCIKGAPLRSVVFPPQDGTVQPNQSGSHSVG